MEKVCSHCEDRFSIEDQDLVFYQKLAVPPPTKCPNCRFQLRLAHSNILHLYSRPSTLSQQPIISMYHAQAPFPVYSVSEWNSDIWNPLDYGREFDFSRTFFEQYHELLKVVPHPALHVLGPTMENTDYANSAAYCKNSYLAFASGYIENCLYVFNLAGCKDIVDGLAVQNSELCYEGIDLVKCFNCSYSQDCTNCLESTFLYQCSNLTSCFGCVNLSNKEYYWFNEPLSKEEYGKRLSETDLGDRVILKQWQDKFEQHKKKFPKLAFHGSGNEDVSGDYLQNCKNALDSFGGVRVEDSRFCSRIFDGIKDAYDVYDSGEGMSVVYETTHSFGGGFNIRFSYGVVGSSDIEYSQVIHGGAKNLFGCFGLKNASYCILNKQYSPEEYADLREKIIAHMQKTGEYGEFFAAALSPWGYNETMADLYFPRTQEQAGIEGFSWYAGEKQTVPQTYVIPNNIKDVQDGILKAVLTDSDQQHNFKLIPQELEFYRKFGIPAPTESFFARNRARWNKRNPERLFATTCSKCGKSIQTSFDPGKGDTIYCTQDFLNEVG